MGFRDVRDYNITLLGNQGWRLLKYPEKLVSRVFKARYFPYGSFLNAEIGSSHSYICRSVLEAQIVIKRGIGCRVGNGEPISIKMDLWLSDENDPYQELVLHIMVHYDFAILTWNNFSKLHVDGNYSTFADWLQLVFGHHSREIATNVVMICWLLWKNKNDLIWNQQSMEASEVVSSACSVLNQWNSVQDRTFDHFMGYMIPEDGDEHWRHPPVNSVKINTDAAIFEESNCYSHAFVVRDHEGKLVEARSRCLRGSLNSELAETLGIKEALSWILEKDQSNAIVESDCLQMVQFIRSSVQCSSYLGRVIQECCALLANLSFKNVKFRFVKRSANKAAHFLARQNCSITDRVWRVGDVHSDFHYVLLNDLNEQ
ncbi:uncharacterized protein LOC141665523 [Apium graveolens]|uniref:uncharacterized protein LOC141665523 n=1 Tax=Apium graveolens TaxID=4045 RepID=UPI003D7BDC00